MRSPSTWRLSWARSSVVRTVDSWFSAFAIAGSSALFALTKGHRLSARCRALQISIDLEVELGQVVRCQDGGQLVQCVRDRRVFSALRVDEGHQVVGELQVLVVLEDDKAERSE